ncbi:hypothetical protein BJV78DRAFT_1350308 [Lactifluus subvellereus]|nr:hypothetical protein BJV78DRAFT_1350308 [Lactifluus subvellereus]
MTDSVDGHLSLPFAILMAQGGPRSQQQVNPHFSGLVIQQFYGYWASGFKDPLRLRLFVVIEFLLVVFQNLLMWDVVYNIYVIFPSAPSSVPPRPFYIVIHLQLLIPIQAQLWAGPTNSLCQLFIILLANVYLADRIHGLTKSRVQSGIVFALSIIAFVFGLVNVVGVWKTPMSPLLGTVTSVIWHTMQAVAECLITFFLARVLLKARSGVRASDSVVNYIIRNVIQTGCLATTWAIIAAYLPALSYRCCRLRSGSQRKARENITFKYGFMDLMLSVKFNANNSLDLEFRIFKRITASSEKTSGVHTQWPWKSRIREAFEEYEH